VEVVMGKYVIEILERLFSLKLVGTNFLYKNLLL
jgi:hypothetical protein